jgi:long-chain fatty acid transport protein
MKTKKFLLGLAVLLAVSSGLLANGLNLNGFGARAAAMGGAFVGLANDYTAVFWNPAGLAMMTKGTFGVTGSFLMPRSTYTLGTFSMNTERKTYPAGLLGYFHPIGDRVVIGVGAYTLSGLGADWVNTGLEGALTAGVPLGVVITPPLDNYIWKSYIGTINIVPAIAVKVTDQFFLGATFNIDFGFFQTQQWGGTEQIAPSILFNLGQATLNVHGWGYGATFGALYKPMDQISVGVSYRMQTKTKLKGTSELENLPLLVEGLSDVSDASMEVISPMWLAGGLAVKPLSNLTLAVDVQWTNWKKVNALTIALTNPGWNAIGLTENTLDLRWKDKIQIRTGLEYTMGNLALRAGYYNDPAPAPDDTMTVLVPAFTYNAVT